MRNIKFSIAAILCAGMLGSCSNDFLEIVPKGKNTLSTLDDTELLLNVSETGGYWTQDILVMDNDIVDFPYSNAYYIDLGNTNINYGQNSWDETFKREGLMKSTSYYSTFYSIIARMNTVINNCENVSGSETKKAQLISEAKVRKAFIYFLLVNIFSKGYTNAEEAKNMGGIPYTDEINLSEENPQLSLAEIYEKIQENLTDDVIANLPDEGENVTRGGKSFAYAVRALVNLYTHNYAQAAKDADACLAINGNIKDYKEFVDKNPTWHYYDKENIYMMYYSYAGQTHIYTPQFMKNYEKGCYLTDYAKNYNLDGPFFEYDISSFIKDEGVTDLTGCAYASKTIPTLGSKDPQFNDTGLRVPQIVVVKAEALALSGNISEAMNTLNSLRKLRVHPDYYTDKTATTEKEAMSYIMPYVLTENAFTCWTFFTRKRWNTLNDYKCNYTRVIGGKTYTMTPESQYWVMPFGQDITDYRTDIKQNY